MNSNFRNFLFRNEAREEEDFSKFVSRRGRLPKLGKQLSRLFQVPGSKHYYTNACLLAVAHAHSD